MPVPVNLLAETAAQRGQLGKTLKSILTALSRPRTKVILDFSRTAKLYPGGTLVLLAHLELLLKSFRGRIGARCPPHSLAAQLLRHFGIADALGINAAGSRPRHESVVNWRYVTGTGADGEKISTLLRSYRDLTAAEIPEGLYDVLAEALINVRHHAYPEDSELPAAIQRWWLFARYVAPNGDHPGNLYIAVYDVGVGIQQSMREKLSKGEVVLETTDALFNLVGMGEAKSLEKLLLQRAVEHNRSSTGLSFRGNGLPEMREFVMSTKSGRLYIISGQAQYACAPAKSASACISCHNEFPGTLILWSIPLSPKGCQYELETHLRSE